MDIWVHYFNTTQHAYYTVCTYVQCTYVHYIHNYYTCHVCMYVYCIVSIYKVIKYNYTYILHNSTHTYVHDKLEEHLHLFTVIYLFMTSIILQIKAWHYGIHLLCLCTIIKLFAHTKSKLICEGEAKSVVYF
jgi:hypothetical protein